MPVVSQRRPSPNGSSIDGVDLDGVGLIEPAHRPFELGARGIHRAAAAAEAVGIGHDLRIGVAPLQRHAARQSLIHLHDAGVIVGTAGLVAAAALDVHREVLRIRPQRLGDGPGPLHVRIREVRVRDLDAGGHCCRRGDLRVQQVDARRPAEPGNQVVHDRHRHLIRIQQAGLEMRSVDAVVVELHRQALPHFTLHRHRPVVVHRRTARCLTVEPIHVVVVRERRIDQRRQRIGRQALIQVERRRHTGIGRREHVLTDEPGEVTAALRDRDASERSTRRRRGRSSSRWRCTRN